MGPYLWNLRGSKTVSLINTRMRPALGNFLRSPTIFTPLSRSIVRPDKVAHVQTDGSFKTNISRTAVVLFTHSGVKHSIMNTYLTHSNSTESEWCSVLNGILYAQIKNEESIELENDCLPVVKHLLMKKPPMKSYLSDYYDMIFKEVKHMQYMSIRWIPREFNRADRLFRI